MIGEYREVQGMNVFGRPPMLGDDGKMCYIHLDTDNRRRNADKYSGLKRIARVENMSYCHAIWIDKDYGSFGYFQPKSIWVVLPSTPVAYVSEFLLGREEFNLKTFNEILEKSRAQDGSAAHQDPSSS